MNAVQLLGNLGRDPIIRATRTGKAVASFSIAVSRIYTTPQGEQRELIHSLREVSEGRGTVVGGYVDRCDMDRYKERMKEIRILVEDEWRLR